MKNVLLTIFAIVMFSNCATIVGGSKYYAHVKVPNHPNAKIEYNGEFQGNGDATFKVKRSKANQLAIDVQDTDCKNQTVNYTDRKFRGWAFAGTVIGWTGWVNFPIPWGVIVDFSTGALYKPDEADPSITKTDLNNYIYKIDYTGCAQ